MSRTEFGKEDLPGMPFNIASHALLSRRVAQQCALGRDDVIWTGGNCHLYSNRLDQVQTQLGREPSPLPHPAQPPQAHQPLFDDEFEGFKGQDHPHHAAIKAPVAV